MLPRRPSAHRHDGTGRGSRRLAPRTPRGRWLTFTVSVGALAALAFGAVTRDVVGHDGMAVHDPHVTAWMVAHRTEWLTSVLRVITWLGSTAVIVPLGVIAGGFFVLRRRRWQPLALLAAAVAGAVSLYNIVKPLIGRPRPPRRYGSGTTRVQLPFRARGSVSCLLRDARHRPGRGEIAPGEDGAVERGRARRAGGGRLTHLPGSPLADRRSGRLCARCLLGCHCRYRHAGRLSPGTGGASGPAPGPRRSSRRTERPQGSLAPTHQLSGLRT